MKSDPLESVTVTPAPAMPPRRGPGSGKEAWIAFAEAEAENGVKLWGMINRQSEVIRELQAEIELLRRQVAKRKPKGGRPRIKDRITAQIEMELASGLSQRQIAARNGVSAMTVCRIAQRVTQRESIMSADH